MLFICRLTPSVSCRALGLFGSRLSLDPRPSALGGHYHPLGLSVTPRPSRPQAQKKETRPPAKAVALSPKYP